MYISMYMCVFVCVYICVYIYTHTSIYLYIYISMVRVNFSVVNLERKKNKKQLLRKWHPNIGNNIRN